MKPQTVVNTNSPDAQTLAQQAAEQFFVAARSKQQRYQSSRRKHHRYLPTFYYHNIFSIDYKKLKLAGITTLCFDLDNTLIPYKTPLLALEVVDLFRQLKEAGFTLLIASNSHYRRVNRLVAALNVPLLGHTWKPFKRRLKRFLASHNVTNLATAALIGDQLMTDVRVANKLGMVSILVNPINRLTEPLRTRFNRTRERRRYEYFKKQKMLIGDSF